jgi:hypothetical protein
LTFWQDIRRRPVVQTGRDRRDWNQSRSSLFNLRMLRAAFQQRSSGEGHALVFVLVNNLDDPDPRVRELSAGMLAGFPTEVAWSVPALEKCLQDEDPTVRAAVRRALEKLPKPPLQTRPAPPRPGNPPPPLGPDAVVLPPR